MRKPHRFYTGSEEKIKKQKFLQSKWFELQMKVKLLFSTIGREVSGNSLEQDRIYFDLYKNSKAIKGQEPMLFLIVHIFHWNMPSTSLKCILQTKLNRKDLCCRHYVLWGSSIKTHWIMNESRINSVPWSWYSIWRLFDILHLFACRLLKQWCK